MSDKLTMMLGFFVYGLFIIALWEVSKPLSDKLIKGIRQRKEDAILWCLRHAPEGLRGLELASLTGVGRGSIYIYLARLEDRGLIRMEFEGVDFPRRSRYYAVAADSAREQQ